MSPGDRVALLLDPDADAVLAIHAVARAGAVVAPLHPRAAAPEIAHAMRAIRPALLVTDRPSSDVGGWQGPVVPPSLDGPRETDPPTHPGSDGDPAAVIWTSGSAGTPRGVVLTAANHRASASGAANRLRLGPDDRWFLALSIAHVGGLVTVTRAALLGSGIVTARPWDASALAEHLRQGRVTHVPLVPTMLRRLLEAYGDRPVSSRLRVMLIGGAAIDAATLAEAVERGFPIALTYGLTETTSQVATAPPDLVRRKPGCVGPPLDGVELDIASDGEILVRGPTVMPGYLGDRGVRTPDEWFQTGDLGQLDEDGHLWVTGRRGDRIVSGGVTVDALEVERVLAAHDRVAEASVVGVPDAEWGELVVAAVTGAPGVAVDVGALDRWCRTRLSAPKRPRRYVVVDALPRNPNGKVDRAAVRRLCTA